MGTYNGISGFGDYSTAYTSIPVERALKKNFDEDRIHR